MSIRQLDRDTWRQERRLWNEVQMDTIYAREYDEQWGASITSTHRRMVGRFLDLCPPYPRILDAACGTGKYYPMLLERGCSVVGTDQSQQMLARAQAKHPNLIGKYVGLQELSFSAAFDGIICMDAMEFVFPEDWPLILGHFEQALSASGHLYFTVEMSSEEELQVAYEAGRRLGLPLIYGEYAHHGGYHHYPTDEQVKVWAEGAGLILLDVVEGDGYRHYLTQR